MINVMADPGLLLPDDEESRRLQERYQCSDINVSYTPYTTRYLRAVNAPAHSGAVRDISLNGLCIEVDSSLTVGDILSLSIHEPDNFNAEQLNAEIMWCKVCHNSHYQVGLKVIGEDMALYDPVNEDSNQGDTLQAEQQLVCPSCNETSFYMQARLKHGQLSHLHTCCRCGHSHLITQVMAFNRQ